LLLLSLVGGACLEEPVTSRSLLQTGSDVISTSTMLLFTLLRCWQMRAALLVELPARINGCDVVLICFEALLFLYRFLI